MRAVRSLLVASVVLVACTDSATGPKPLLDRTIEVHANQITTWTAEVLALPPGHSIGEVEDINDSRLSVGWTQAFNTPSPRPVRWSAAGTPSLLTMPGSADGGNAIAINNAGQIVGWAKSGGLNQPARLGANPVLLSPGLSGSAMDINSAGAVVGYIYVVPGSGTSLPVHWSASGTPTALGLPTGYFEAAATGISDDGTITGWVHYRVTSGSFVFEDYRAVMWTSPSATPVLLGEGQLAPLWVTMSPDATIVIASDNGSSGFSQSFMPPYAVMAGSTTSIAARARSGRRRMVGHNPATNLARTRRDGTSIDLGLPPGALASSAIGVNSCGSAVGYYRTTTALNLPLPVRWERSGICDAPW